MPSPHKPRCSIVKPHPAAIEMLKQRAMGGAQIAPGFRSNAAMNMTFHGGRTLPHLQFKNFYLGQWTAADMDSIDHALSGALTDTNLNHVMQQYFQEPITTTFLGRVQHSDASLTPGATFDRDAVHATLASLDLADLALDTAVICLYLPPGVILDTRAKGGVGDARTDQDSSLEGLGGYHGSAQLGDRTVYFAVAVYSQQIGNTTNGIPFWPAPWKNIVATMYHELNEVRTDADVEEAERTSNDRLLGWYADGYGEIGDLPVREAEAHLGLAMVEVPLVAGGTAPIQLMWSNAVGGPSGPF